MREEGFKKIKETLNEEHKQPIIQYPTTIYNAKDYRLLTYENGKWKKQQIKREIGYSTTIRELDELHLILLGVEDGYKLTGEVLKLNKETMEVTDLPSTSQPVTAMGVPKQHSDIIIAGGLI